MHVIRYFTCEGRFSHLHAHHFKLLSCIRHNIAMNLPNFLYNMLCISVEETQKGKDNSITHHALIKLLIERSLRDVSPLTWDEFVKFKTLQPQVDPSEQQGEENVVSSSEPAEQNIEGAETENAQQIEPKFSSTQKNVPPPKQDILKPTTSQAKRK